MPLFEDLSPARQQRRIGSIEVLHETTRRGLPLRSLSYRARVLERFAEVTVEQTFDNDLRAPLEAVYTFPLAAEASIAHLEVQFGDRTLVGVVAERGDARRAYDAAVAKGQQTAIVEQERADVFTVKLGNLAPGASAIVRLVYNELLPAFENGEKELRLPLVVAPRFAPATSPEQPLEPPRLSPGVHSGVALAIAVEIWEETEPAALSCTQHATCARVEEGKLRIELARDDELLDRDFVLRWRAARERETTHLCVTRLGEHVYGVLSLAAPHARETSGSRDVVFLLDRSGSMDGEKMTAARRAVGRLLSQLGAGDRFSIAAFDDKVEWFTGAASPAFVEATDLLVAKARAWLETIRARSGTHLAPALESVLHAAREREGRADRTSVVVLVTDGQVGNEGEILARAERLLGSTRVFTFGIDTAVNAAFLRRLARLGRGTATLGEPGALEPALERLGRELRAPVLLDLEIDGPELGIELASLVPERLPDLWAGGSEAIFFRARSTSGAVVLRARRPTGERFELRVQAEDVPLPALAQLWARARVQDLEDRHALSPAETIDEEILALALRHRILSRLTAFLVVDRERAQGVVAARPVRVVQPVENPARWGPFVSKNDPDFRPGRISRPEAQPRNDEISYRRATFERPLAERDRWHRASSKRKRTTRPPPTSRLQAPLRDLAAALLRVLEALEAGRWPDDGGAALARHRFIAVTAIRTAGLGTQVDRTRALLEELGALLAVLQLRTGSPADHRAAFREVARALKDECSIPAEEP